MRLAHKLQPLPYYRGILLKVILSTLKSMKCEALGMNKYMYRAACKDEYRPLKFIELTNCSAGVFRRRKKN